MSTQIDNSADFSAGSGQLSLRQSLMLFTQVVGQSSSQSFLDRLRIADPVVRVFALAELCEPERPFPDQVLVMAEQYALQSSHMRQMLTLRISNSMRSDLIDSVVAVERRECAEDSKLPEQLMLAQRNCDFAAQLSCHEKLFMQTGNPRHITEAAKIARNEMAWPSPWEPALRALFTATGDIEQELITVLEMLVRCDARDEFEALAREIDMSKLYPNAQVFSIAQLCFWQKDYRMCSHVLKSTNFLAVNEDHWAIAPNLAARCAEELGDFRQAAVWYDKQNKAQASEAFPPARFIERVNELASLEITELPTDPRTNYFIMTGFTRSGTTLLENVLAAHPLIATCEERSSLVGTVAIAYETTLDPTASNSLNIRAEIHRKLYYQNLDRFANNPNAKVVIDKTPIISGNIKYLEKLFPNKRYIFSIRNPYDVVLSNWKQIYRQNLAMTAFNNIHDACVLYDHVMRSWFDVFPGETDRVYYVRYDELVTDFRRVVEGALLFLGVQWTDELVNFAQHSAARNVKTPSYAKVRQGLKIGVQSSWQNFDFLFDEKCRALLDPWSKRFGYAA